MSKSAVSSAVSPGDAMAPSGAIRAWKVEATSGFEPLNRGFADLLSAASTLADEPV